MFFYSRIANWRWNRKRRIFHYFDGTNQRRADPLILTNQLEGECPNYMALLELIYKDPTQDPPGELREQLVREQNEAITTLTGVIRKIFDIQALNENGGLTQGETIRVLTQFFMFMEGLAAKAQVFPTSPGAA